MLLRIGDVEADVKVAAVMSTPRLGFTDNFFCVGAALAPHGISPTKVSGAFWGQSLQFGIESVLDDHDVVLTIDYDSIFSSKTVEALLALMLHSGVDAIAPLQTKRESNSVMLSPPGFSPEEKAVVDEEWFKKPVQPVDTAHFGLTFLRTAAIKKLPKPWFVEKANESGRFDGGHQDADIGFWRAWKAAGNTLGVSTHISIGHAELMITWPSRGGSGRVQQHTTEFWRKMEPAEGAWGFVK